MLVPLLLRRPFPPLDPHFPNRQRTQINMSCTKQKRSEGDGQPGELRISQDPALALRVTERVLGLLLLPPPAPPRSLTGLG